MRDSLTGTALSSIPARGIAQAHRLPFCIYWFRDTDGSLWRSNLDGTIRELVIDCRAKKNGRLSAGVRLDPNRSQGRSFLAAGSVPWGSGYAIVEPPTINVPQESSPMFDSQTFEDVVEILPYWGSDRPSPWTVRLDVEGFQPTDHSHCYLARAILSKAGTSRMEYRYGSYGGMPPMLLEGDLIVIFDPPKVVVWTLQDDHKYQLASGWEPVLWPRDLSRPPRFKPVAKAYVDGKLVTWEMQSPADLSPPKEARQGP